jgi:DNA-binding CsgD family transcriptional regulator/tetratricopeptide (TPR) repeat protein
VGDAEAQGSLHAATVFGRTGELARIDAFLEAVSSRAGALVIRGEPGIGKTTLLRLGLAEARRAGHTVLVARPAEEERSLALGGLVDLFEDTGLDAVGLQDEADPFVRGRVVLAELRRLAGATATLVAIDDLQWLDSASARALRYALRRLDAEPVGVLATARVGAEDPLATNGLFPPGRAETLDLGALTLEALRSLLHETVGAVSRPTLRRIHDVSEGNPLFAIELARSLAKVDPALRPAGELRLPDSLQEAIAGRLETVPDELLPLLETASALGRASVSELVDALPDEEVTSLLESAESHGFLVVGDDLEIRFSHPLVGSAVYGRMSPLARRTLHSGLAEVTVDPDLRARHLALSTDEPDAEVARLLEEAAGRAGERGAHDAAADLAGQSLRLTPPRDAEARRRRATAEIDALAAAGEVGRARALADDLVAALPAGSSRGEALVQRFQLVDEESPASEALLLQALQDASDDDMLRSRVLRDLAGLLGWEIGDMRRAIPAAREALEIAESLADPELEMLAAATLSHLEAVAGAPRPDLVERAASLQAEVGSPATVIGPRTLRAKQIFWAGDLETAKAEFEAILADMVRHGNEFRRPFGLYDVVLAECAAGELTVARRLVDEALEAARDSEDVYAESWLLYPLGLVDAWLGSAEEARATASRLLERARARASRSLIVRGLSVRGFVALSEDDAQGAARELVEAAELLGSMGYAHPGAFPVLPDAIEALVASGDVEAAEAHLERLEREAAAVRSDWALAVAERCRGLLALARGDAEAALPALGAAGASLDERGYGLDAARSLLLEGRALLRSGRRSVAADALAGARDRFSAMGAELWAARAAEELERAAPGRAAGELTATESRIARLVAEGRKNREIGEALFLSVATVEGHLTRLYRKLGIRSRSELTRLVADGSIELAPDADE